MKGSSRTPAFSLLEVIIAVGIFGGAVAVILGLVGVLSRQAAESAEILVAQQLPDSIETELERLAARGFDELANRIPVMGSPDSLGFPLVTRFAGGEVQATTFLPPATPIPVEEQYFLVECWRFPDGPLRFDRQDAALPVLVRVSWPYRVPGADAPVPAAGRHFVTFTVSLYR